MRPPEFWILNGHCVCFGDFAKECFHLPGRGKHDENSSSVISIEGPNMGHLTRAEQRITWLQAHPFPSDLKNKFTLHNVKPLILVMMQVPGRAAFLVKGVFKDKKVAVILMRNFKIDLADAKSTVFAKAIFSLGTRMIDGKCISEGDALFIIAFLNTQPDR